MAMPPALLLRALLPALLLAGCGSPPAAAPAERDPAVTGALAAPLMTDPDLAGLNPANAALVGGGPAEAAIPLEDPSAEAIAAGRSETVRLAGRALDHAPEPSPGTAAPAGLTAVQTATIALGPGAGRCTVAMHYTAAWAARLPPAFPVYPRGHVAEAAGIDAPGCVVRSVNYRTPVPLNEVADFYWTRTRAAGFAADYRLAGGERVLRASRSGAVAVIYLRQQGGMTEVDLVTSGG